MRFHAPRVLPLLATLMAMAALPRRACEAFDVGDPTFRSDPDAPAHRVEFMFDSMDRRVRVQHDRVLVGTPTDGPVGSFPALPESIDSIDGNSSLVRYTYLAGELVSAQFDLGYNGESSGGDSAIILGGAARLLLISEGPFQLASQFTAHFVPESDLEERGSNPSLGAYVARGQSDFYEYGLALLGSLELPASESVSAMLYGGPRFTAIRGRTSAVVDYENPVMVGGSPVGNRAWFSSVQEEETVFGAVLGLRIDCGEHWTGRVETRLIEEESFSFSLGTRF